MSLITNVFLENFSFLKCFLTRFIDNEQDIEDIIQDTYIKATAAEKDQTIHQPKAFLFAVAKNLALTELRKKSKKIKTELDECMLTSILISESSLESELEAEQQLKQYCEVISALPEKVRRVYILRKVYGLKHKEIAEMMGISLSSVEKNLKLAILYCKDVLVKKRPTFSNKQAYQETSVKEVNSQ